MFWTCSIFFEGLIFDYFFHEKDIIGLDFLEMSLKNYIINRDIRDFLIFF